MLMSQDSTNKIINQLQVRIKQLEKYTSELEKELNIKKNSLVTNDRKSN